MKIINTTRLPEALGPYSHATVVNGMGYGLYFWSDSIEC